MAKGFSDGFLSTLTEPRHKIFIPAMRGFIAGMNVFDCGTWNVTPKVRATDAPGNLLLLRPFLWCELKMRTQSDSDSGW